MRYIFIVGFVAALPAIAQELRQEQLEQFRLVQQLSFATEQIRGAQGVVKNSPYSAEATTTTTQVLSDGNRIEQSTSQKLYRDSQGRERREETPLAIGALAQPDAPMTVTISDPMERVSYTLNPQAHTARRTPGAGSGHTFTYMGMTKTFTFMTTVPASANTDRAKEDLGSKTIEGVMAQGTRTTETIPAGQIGNLLPINIVDETWYSPELKMNILTTHSDPRSGESVYKLTNINRGEQPRSLFEPPADYTVAGPGAGGRGVAPAK